MAANRLELILGWAGRFKRSRMTRTPWPSERSDLGMGMSASCSWLVQAGRDRLGRKCAKLHN